ncbi:MAG: N utilization substance protein B [Paracoccaceae bacterium]|jgi:N utilization substance protein B
MTEPAERAPKKSNGGGTARRSAARLAAVQALYQIDHSGTPGDEVLEEFLRFRLGDSFDTEQDVAPHKNLFSEIVSGVGALQPGIDEIIASALSNKWTFERVEIILRAILRAGVYELRARKDTPARVVITEYVDIAHAFYDGQEPGMVNGMLDRISRSLRPGEFGDAKPAPESADVGEPENGEPENGEPENGEPENGEPENDKPGDGAGDA